MPVAGAPVLGPAWGHKIDRKWILKLLAECEGVRSLHYVPMSFSESFIPSSFFYSAALAGTHRSPSEPNIFLLTSIFTS